MNLAVKWLGVAVVMYSVPVAVGKTIEWAQGVTQPLPPLAAVSTELKPRSRGRMEALEARVARLESIVTEEAMKRDKLDRLSAGMQESQSEFNNAVLKFMQEPKPTPVALLPLPPAQVDVNVSQQMIQQQPLPLLNNPLLSYPGYYR